MDTDAHGFKACLNRTISGRPLEDALTTLVHVSEFLFLNGCIRPFFGS